MVRGDTWDDTMVSSVPSWPSCSNISGLQETLVLLQPELNKVWDLLRPLPIGLFLIIIDRSLMAMANEMC